MRLLFPSPGEVWDRITVLKLKLKVAAGRNLVEAYRVFDKEKRGLESYIVNYPVYPALEAKVEELQSVNARLWKLEDDRREMFKKSDRDVHGIVQNAEETTVLNDKRAALVQEINSLFGVVAPEKLY